METERKGWLLTSLLLFIAFWLLVCGLNACRSRPAPPAKPKTILVMDTTRTRLVHRADITGRTVLILHERNTKTLSDYDQAAADYDSTVVHLR